MENAPRAAGPTPSRAPEYREFSLALDLFRKLEQQRDIRLVYEVFPSADRSPRIVMQTSDGAWLRPGDAGAGRHPRAQKGLKHYPLVYPALEHEGDDRAKGNLVIETRSLLGILFFLSQPVEASERHVQAGKVALTRYETGELFDWDQIVGGLFRVKSQEMRPLESYTAVHYRGIWFYIDDSDLESKATFSLLSQLLALQSGKTDRLVPLLTLPLGK